ncbi:serine/threonine-protein kinase [Sphingobacterium faecale]|uniref:Serine/threonine protein kinase n=1 Tax=Sphingobacterium faecale TaxID=2803775 RepID=A0ABS1R8P5_9SPHI|nr:serine/threonine-protein kinase [Sphingobacterium faecale]MBL1411095.1 serine/threonine protein kinase [Sphingobacterium faecale]
MFKKDQIIEVEGAEYKLDKKKGEGGAGTVWTAESGGQQFAIKYIKSESLLNDKSGNKIARFKAEISFSKHATHRNIVKVIAEGNHQGTPFYVMPFYSRTLRQVIDEEEKADMLIKYILKICAALKYIHRKGIRHRDIKPENILIDGNNLVLADFGIAHFKEYGLTKKSDWLANRNYMAPEQKTKNNVHNVHEAADVYALGLIVNECFTKQNPAGSQFKKIADSYPLFYELDNLVENMTRNAAADRIAIDSVIAQIKFIHQQLKKNLEDIRCDLEIESPPLELKSSIIRKIYRRASEDILFGKYLFETHSRSELNRYNRNWHMKVGYRVDYFLYNLYIQERLLQICKAKFEYESNIYRKDNWHQTLDLINNDKHTSLYLQLSVFLEKYDLKHNGYPLLDLSGQILKYFSSCADYHCVEILERMQEIEDSAKYNLTSAPIIFIVIALKQGIVEKRGALSDGINGFGGRFEFRFENHILIDWDRTQEYEYNEDEEELLYSYNLEKEEELQQILAAFRRKWKMTYSNIDDDYYSIKFSTINQFERFSSYALSIAKPHYIFEGDVLDILEEPNYVGNMVELKLGKVFDIPNTLAQILGLKEVHA